jgi:hypothetical protein
MKPFRGYEFTAAELTRVANSQEPVVLTVGRSKVGKLYVLPIQSWSVSIWEIYGGNALDKMSRVTTRTSKSDGLSEGVLLGVLMGQVDENWKPVPDSCLVITLDGDDSAVLVPANAYWRVRVEPEGEGE